MRSSGEINVSRTEEGICRKTGKSLVECYYVVNEATKGLPKGRSKASLFSYPYGGKLEEVMGKFPLLE